MYEHVLSFGYQTSGISVDRSHSAELYDQMMNLNLEKNMNEWYEPSLRADFYDPYYYEDHTYDDYVHVDDLPDLDHARDHMKAVLEALYGKGSLEDLENHLEEVLAILEMSMPAGSLSIKKEAI